MKNQSPKHDRWLLPLGAITLAVSSALMVGCSSSSSGGGGTTSVPTVEEPVPLALEGTALACDAEDAVDDSVEANGLFVETPDGVPPSSVSHWVDPDSRLNANAGQNIKRLGAVVAAQDPDGGSVLNDDELAFDTHPIVVSYTEQVIGDYALGDGSADIGDPTQIDDPFVSLSLDNGKSWKKVQLAKTSEESSIATTWAGNKDGYPGHSHKSTMAVQGENILVAWNDKYCQKANPYDLEQVIDGEDITYPDDLYQVNGDQDSIDYEGIEAPNGKMLYEVPFSCVWAARGVFTTDLNGDGDTTTNDIGIEWRKAEQLTSGKRDSNKIWIAPAPVGFALSWQEDTKGLRAGKGAGPGEGYSGATTNHGTDIWYTHITMEDFDNVCLTDDCDIEADTVGGTEWTDDQTIIADVEVIPTKPKPSHKFALPVRISNNEICDYDEAKENKLYCRDDFEVDDPTSDNPADTITLAKNCIGESEPIESNNQSGTEMTRCVQYDLDYMTEDSGTLPANAVLDGDTGASRPALKILKTNEKMLNPDYDPLIVGSLEYIDEYVAILVYEETKALSESDPGSGVPVNGDDDLVDVVNIAQEGKAVYFESFLWNDPVTVSAGRIVNLRVPEVNITQDEDKNIVVDENGTGRDIYENARRVVIASQVDSCDAADKMVEGELIKNSNPTFAIMYKQGYDTQGGPSDMYIRRNYGFTFETFENSGIDEDGFEIDPVTTNVSSRTVSYADDGKPDAYEWSSVEDVDTQTRNNLLDQSYDDPEDNTFSPRAFLRGAEIYTGFEYSPSWRMTNQGTVPNNFWIHTYLDPLGGDALAWQGPKQISLTSHQHHSTLDPRFVTTPKGRADATADVSIDEELIESDTSNPNVLFLSYGTFDMANHEEVDLFYLRSTDRGATWEYLDAEDNILLISDHGLDGIFGTEDDPVGVTGTGEEMTIDFKIPMLAHKIDIHEMEVQSLASPNGGTLFNVFNYEEPAESSCTDPVCGLETLFKRADYDFDPDAIQ